MERRTLEITLQSATGLNKVNFFTKMDVYAVVSISGGENESEQKFKSFADHIRDTNPTWNFLMKFTIDEAAMQMNRLTLDFKLVCQRALGDKDVGQVLVPIKKLLDSNGGSNGEVYVSYQVRKPDGKPKGQISFSYKFNEKYVCEPVPRPPIDDEKYAPVKAYIEIQVKEMYRNIEREGDYLADGMI